MWSSTLLLLTGVLGAMATGIDMLRPILIENRLSRGSGDKNMPELIDIGPLVAVAASMEHSRSVAIASNKPTAALQPTTAAIATKSAESQRTVISSTPVSKAAEPQRTANSLSTAPKNAEPRSSVSAVATASITAESQRSASAVPSASKNAEPRSPLQKVTRTISAQQVSPESTHSLRKVVIANKVEVTTVIDYDDDNDVESEEGAADRDQLDRFASIVDSAGVGLIASPALVLFAAVVGYF